MNHYIYEAGLPATEPVWTEHDYVMRAALFELSWDAVTEHISQLLRIRYTSVMLQH